MKSTNLFALGLILALISAPGAVAFADTAKATTGDAWKLETSLTAKAFYDTNLYDVNVGPLGNQKSFGAAFAPSVKATGKLWNVDVIAGYTPTFTFYDKHNNLDYLSQAFNLGEKFTAWDFTWDLKQSLLWVVGDSSEALYANDAGTTFSPGFTAPTEQARVDQLVWGESFNVAKKWDRYLLEFVGAGTYQDWRTYQDHTTAGYINLTDRYDVNAGFDVGYKAYHNIYVLLGYRAGHQWQGLNSTSTLQYTNDYNRALAGLRGDMFDKKLAFDFLAGPDFRHFSGIVNGPFKRNQTLWYYSGTASYKPTKSDAFSATFTRTLGMASGGANTHEDAVTTLKYSRIVTSQWSIDGGVTMDIRPYLANAGSTTPRYIIYSPFVGVNYTPKGNLSYRAAYAYNSVQTDTPKSASVADVQEYSQSIVSLEAKYKF